MCYGAPVLTVEYYIDAQGNNVLNQWRRQLPDRTAQLRIAMRIDRLERGGFGDCKPIENGVWEMRIDYGPGYRLYYSMIGRTVVLLLCGGDKRKQQMDITRAVLYLNDYKRRQS